MPELPTKESVFGRRTVPQSTRGIYGYRAGQEAEADARRGQTISSIGADVEVKAKEMNDEQNKLDLLRAQTKALDDYSRLEREMEQDPDATWETYEPKFREADAATVGIFRDKKMAGEFGYRLQQMTIGARDKYSQISESRNIDQQRANYALDKDSLVRVLSDALQTGDTAKADATVKILSELPFTVSGANPKVLSREQAAVESIGVSSVVAESLKSVSDPSQLMETLKGSVKIGPPKPMAGGFEAHIPLLQQVEGGYVKSDGASGFPAVYGINAKYHQAEFDEAMRITETEGEAAGKAYAAEFYKKQYWDANGLDKYTPEQQAVLFDGMVNHRSDFRTELLSAADKGASPVELLAMRHKEYQRLARNPEYAPSYRGWMKRLNDVERAVGVSTEKTGTAVDYLAPGDRAELLEWAEKKYEQMLPEMAVEEYKWKPFEQLSDKYAGNAGSQEAISKLQKSLVDDPVAYVQEYPSVFEARSKMEQDPTPQNVTNYNAAVWDAQSELGLPSYKKRITSPKQVEDMSAALATAQSADDNLKIVDNFRQQYQPGKQRARAIHEASQGDKIPPAFSVLLKMSENDPTRPVLAAALTMTPADMAAAAGVSADAINKDVNKKLSDYSLAVSTDPDNGPREAVAMQQAVSLVSMSYMQRGMEKNEAIKKAQEHVLPATIKGSLIIPNSIPNPDNVETAAEEFRVNIQDMNIVVPNEIRDDDIRSEVYKRSVARDAKPVVDGDRVIFVGLDGNAILDADLAQFDPDTGEVLNEDAAILSFPLTDAAIYPDGISKAAPELVQKRADASYAAGKDVKQAYFTQSFFDRLNRAGGLPQEAYIPDNEFGKSYIPVKAVTKDQYAAMPEYQRKIYKRHAENSYAYFQNVLSSIRSEKGRADLIELAKSSNEPMMRIMELKDEMKKSGSQLYFGVRTQESVIAEMKENRLKASAGIGYNYYNGLPDWMVD